MLTKINNYSYPNYSKITMLAMQDFKDFITDPDALTVALYGGDVHEAARYLQLPINDPAHIAAARAKDFHFHTDTVQAAASMSFWEDNLNKLLTMAKANSDHGTKLAQIFVRFLDHTEEHHLSPLLITKLLIFLDKKATEDGFLITRQDGNTIFESIYLGEVC